MEKDVGRNDCRVSEIVLGGGGKIYAGVTMVTESVEDAYLEELHSWLFSEGKYVYMHSNAPCH